MNKRLIIFGASEYAQLAHHYFSKEGDFEVVAFTVDSAYRKETSLCGLPIIAFEEIGKDFKPDDCHFFVAMGFSRINALRKEKYLAVKALGYRLASFISPRATVLNDGRIGENTFIFEDNTIQPFVTIGSNVTLWSGNHIGHHSTIRDHCFITSHVVISGGVEVGEQCFIGVNATLRDHIKIGERCVIGAGALILEDAAADGVYFGNGTERSRIPSSRLRGM